MDKNTVIVAVTCYGNEKEVINFAKMLEQQKNKTDIVLLITCNKTNNIQFLRKSLMAITYETHVYEPNKNLGYLHGCLYGIKKYVPENWNGFIMISNTDIILNSIYFFNDILNLKLYDLIGGIAPNIVLPNGKKQNPFLCDRPPIKKIKRWWKILGNPILFSYYNYLSEIKKKFSYKNQEQKETEKYIYAAHGSCFFLKMECINALIKIKDEIFMYGEEILVAEIVRAINKKIYFCPKLVVLHNENSTTGKINRKNKVKWYNTSYKYLYKNFFEK